MLELKSVSKSYEQNLTLVAGSQGFFLFTTELSSPARFLGSATPGA